MHLISDTNSWERWKTNNRICFQKLESHLQNLRGGAQCLNPADHPQQLWNYKLSEQIEEWINETVFKYASPLLEGNVQGVQSSDTANFLSITHPLVNIPFICPCVLPLMGWYPALFTQIKSRYLILQGLSLGHIISSDHLYSLKGQPDGAVARHHTVTLMIQLWERPDVRNMSRKKRQSQLIHTKTSSIKECTIMVTLHSEYWWHGPE